MKLIKQHDYVGQRVVLDGRSFVECRFSNCVLVLEGDGLFQMDRCQIADDCRFAVEGGAKVCLDGQQKLMYQSDGGWLAVSKWANALLTQNRAPPVLCSVTTVTMFYYQLALTLNITATFDGAYR